MMNNTTEKLEEVERKISLVKLMIEKRKERKSYYERLVTMGVASTDKDQLELHAKIKETEINELLKELNWLYIQQSYYEL